MLCESGVSLLFKSILFYLLQNVPFPMQRKKQFYDAKTTYAPVFLFLVFITSKFNYYLFFLLYKSDLGVEKKNTKVDTLLI